jgi:hypothetical protein
MKKCTFLLLTLISISLVAQEKKEIVLKTDVSEATVFIKGAQVVRKTTLSLPAGKSIVRFSNLSPYVDTKSVQVKIDGEVMVLSVNHQLNYNDSVKQSDEIEKYAKQISDLNESIKLEQTTKEIINEELTFLRDNKKIGGTDKGVDFANLKATSTYYGERISALKMKEIETDNKIKTLSEEKNSIERKIAVAGSIKPEPTGEVILTVDCKTALRVPAELSYYVNNAGWYPSYDIRAKSISEPVELVYKANIMQNTKEEWKNVKLKVSSVNPNLGNVAPKLKTYFLNYYTQPPRYDGNDLSNQVRGKITDESGEPLIGASVTIKGSTIGTAADLDGNFSLSIPAVGGELQISYIGFNPKTLPISNSYMNIVLEESQLALEEVVATGYGTRDDISRVLEGRLAGVSVKNTKPKNIPLPVIQIENTTSVEFEIKTPYTILSENKNTTIEMERYSLPAEYEYYCVPKVDKDAFLLANVSDWEQYNLLEGEANIFFENTFIGKTILDVRYVSDTLNISLGRDKNVSVQREKVKEYTTQKFLGSKAETTRDWKLIVKNNKRQPISMVLFDQIPVSTTQEIEVIPELLSDGELDKDNGEVKWKFTLPPTQKSEWELKYKVKYPKGRTLTVE